MRTHYFYQYMTPMPTIFFHFRKSSTCGIIDEEVEQTTSLIAETSIAATGEPFAKRKHTNEENDKDAPVEEPVPSTSSEKDTSEIKEHNIIRAIEDSGLSSERRDGDHHVKLCQMRENAASKPALDDIGDVINVNMTTEEVNAVIPEQKLVWQEIIFSLHLSIISRRRQRMDVRGHFKDHGFINVLGWCTVPSWMGYSVYRAPCL